MAELKTKPQATSVKKFVGSIEDPQKRADCAQLVKIMGEITGEKPTMWGDSIVGFGSYHFKYASGREGDWFVCGFAPRKQNLVLYIMSGFKPHQNLLDVLGKHKTGKGCLYVKKLSDIDLDVLEQLIQRSVEYVSRNK